MTKRKERHVYKLAWIIGPTYRDDPNIEFPNILNLVAYAQTAYPDHTQYEIIATKAT